MYLVSMILALAAPCWVYGGSKQAGPQVFLQAQTIVQPVRINTDAGQADAWYLASPINQYVFLPKFELRELKVSITPNQALVLAREPGTDRTAVTSGLASLVEGDARTAHLKTDIHLILRMSDLVREDTDLFNAMLDEPTKSSINGRQPIASPISQDAWQAVLRVRDPAAPQQMRELARCTFSTEAGSSRVLDFTIHAGNSELGRLLRGGDAALSDFDVRILGSYTAWVSELSQQQSLLALSEGLSTLASHVHSYVGRTDAVFVIPLGGSATEDMSLERISNTRRLLNVVTFDNKPPDKVQTALLQAEIQDVRRQIEAQVALNDMSDNRKVMLILSNGARISTTIGRISSEIRRLATYDETQTQELAKDIWNKAHREERKRIIELTAIDEGGEQSGSFDFSRRWEDIDSGEQLKIAKSLHKSLKNADDEVQGDMPTITGMKLDQINQLRNTDHALAVAQAGRGTRMTYTYSDTLSFTTLPAAYDQTTDAVTDTGQAGFDFGESFAELKQFKTFGLGTREPVEPALKFGSGANYFVYLYDSGVGAHLRLMTGNKDPNQHFTTVRWKPSTAGPGWYRLEWKVLPVDDDLSGGARVRMALRDQEQSAWNGSGDVKIIHLGRDNPIDWCLDGRQNKERTMVGLWIKISKVAGPH